LLERLEGLHLHELTYFLRSVRFEIVEDRFEIEIVKNINNGNANVGETSNSRDAIC